MVESMDDNKNTQKNGGNNKFINQQQNYRLRTDSSRSHRAELSHAPSLIIRRRFLQQGISEPVFYGDLVQKNLKESLESLILVINLKRLLNVIYE